MDEDVELEILHKEYEDLKFTYGLLLCQNKDCVNYLIPPQRQCFYGHSLCAFCIWKETCPVCHGSIIKTQNHTLQAIIELLLVPCKNEALGCSELFPPFLREDHEVQCIYNYVKCIHRDCTWRGARSNLWVHLTNSHPQDMILDNELIIQFNMGTPFTYHKILKYEDIFFVIKVVYDTFSDKVFAAVRQAGDNFSRGVTYSFTIHSQKGKGQKDYQYKRETHESHRRFGYIFKMEDCFVVSKEFLTELCGEDVSYINLNLLIDVEWHDKEI